MIGGKAHDLSAQLVRGQRDLHPVAHRGGAVQPLDPDHAGADRLHPPMVRDDPQPRQPTRNRFQPVHHVTRFSAVHERVSKGIGVKTGFIVIEEKPHV